MIHELVQETGLELNDWQLYDEYLKLGLTDEPVALRHLFTTKPSTESIHIDKVKDASHILRTLALGDVFEQ